MSSLDKNTSHVIQQLAKTLGSIVLYLPFGFIKPIAQSIDKAYYYLRLKNLTKTYHKLEGIPKESQFFMLKVMHVYEKALFGLAISFHFILSPLFFASEQILPIQNFLFMLTGQEGEQTWVHRPLAWLKNNPAKVAYFVFLPLTVGPSLAALFGINSLVDAYLFYTCSMWSGLIINTLANFITQTWRASEWLDIKKFIIELGTGQSEKDWVRYTRFVSISSLNLSFDLVSFNHLNRLGDWAAGCIQYFKEWLALYVVLKVSANHTPDLMLKLESYLEMNEDAELISSQSSEPSMTSALGNGLWLTTYHFLHSLGSNDAIDYYHQKHLQESQFVEEPTTSMEGGLASADEKLCPRGM